MIHDLSKQCKRDAVCGEMEQVHQFFSVVGVVVVLGVVSASSNLSVWVLRYRSGERDFRATTTPSGFDNFSKC